MRLFLLEITDELFLINLFPEPCSQEHKIREEDDPDKRSDEAEAAHHAAKTVLHHRCLFLLVFSFKV